MAEPNPEDPLNKEAARIYVEDRDQFNEMATKFTRMHAC